MNKKDWSVGDLAQVPEPLMSATWYCELRRQRLAPSSECWITLGRFVPWKNEDGSNVSDFWDSYPEEEVARATVRQLGASSFLEPENLADFEFLEVER